MRLNSAIIPILALLGATSAHPGEIEEHGTPARRDFLNFAQRSIEGCKEHLVARGHEAKAIARRAALAEHLRQRRGLPVKRDLASVLATDHKSNATGLTANSTAAEVFTGKLNCVLQPEVTIGPYWVDGELIRSNIVEDQKGVHLYTDFQIIDVSTCEPIPNVYVDAWHANSTGVYAGVVSSGNGNINDASNINATFLRGIVKTDADGVAQFETLVPGHYTGRTNHIHVLATLNATVNANNTLNGGHVAHVGQVFLDQSLLSSVEATSPYSTNTQEQTLNSADNILAEEAASMDPFLEYVLLGNDISDGVLGWISIGIDPTKELNTSAASTLTSNGGVANANAGQGGGGMMGPPPNANGTFNGTGLANSSTTASSAGASATTESSSSAATQTSASFLFGLFAFVWAL